MIDRRITRCGVLRSTLIAAALAAERKTRAPQVRVGRAHTVAGIVDRQTRERPERAADGAERRAQQNNRLAECAAGGELGATALSGFTRSLDFERLIESHFDCTKMDSLSLPSQLQSDRAQSSECRSIWNDTTPVERHAMSPFRESKATLALAALVRQAGASQKF